MRFDKAFKFDFIRDHKYKFQQKDQLYSMIEKFKR